jgi:DNA-binding FadR family transcriptional regulator
MAAERRTAHDVIALKRASEIMTAAGPDTSPSEMARMNSAFHRAIWRAGRNESLIDLLDRLHSHLRRYPETTLAHPGRWQESNEEHTELVAAIEARDIELADAIARKHFGRARDIRLALWSEM